MPTHYLKTATLTAQSTDASTTETVQTMLREIRIAGEDRVRAYAHTLDGWDGPIVLGPEAFARAEKALAQGVKDDIRFAHQRVTDFARQQRTSMQEFDV